MKKQNKKFPIVRLIKTVSAFCIFCFDRCSLSFIVTEKTERVFELLTDLGVPAMFYLALIFHSHMGLLKDDELVKCLTFSIEIMQKRVFKKNRNLISRIFIKKTHGANKVVMDIINKQLSHCWARMSSFGHD